MEDTRGLRYLMDAVHDLADRNSEPTSQGGIMSINEAKKLIHAELTQRGLAFTRITARTIDFTDLARTSAVFVKIHGWKPNPVWADLEGLAKQNGFCIEA